MPQITLPDGSSRTFDHPVAIADIAADIAQRCGAAIIADYGLGLLTTAALGARNRPGT